MRSFDDIRAIAAERKGGAAALDALLAPDPDAPDIATLSDDRILATMARCIFQSGFNWKVVEAKWPGFEAGFDGFDPGRVALYGDDDLDRLLADTGVIRNGAKLSAVIENAGWVTQLARDHGSARAFFADWPADDQVGLMQAMAKRGSRLGGNTGQYVLRFIGRDSFILSRDVVARLTAEGVIDGPATGKRAQAAIQAAFNTWAAESGRSLREISRTLAYSV
ncbi:MAG: DNA-3-methyladenine glycosylase I [Maritimibacter sp.]|nr:DNA-3-methyladenine glycosylase I [Maritimibacter sp.]